MIVVAGPLARRDEDAHGGLRAEFTLHPADRNRGAGIIRRREAAIVGGDRAEGPRAALAGEANAKLRILNAAREEQHLGHQARRRIGGRGAHVLEHRCALEKERTLLRVEQLEALVHGHLGLVRLDLAEIRVDGQVQRHGVLDHHLGIEAGTAIEWRVEDARRGIQIPSARDRGVRNELQVAASRHAIGLLDGRELLRHAFHPPGDVRPERLLAVAGNDARQGHAPRALVARQNAQALERDRDQHGVAVGQQPAAGAPHRIETVVILAPSLDSASAWMPRALTANRYDRWRS